MHIYHQPLPVIESMEIQEVMDWGRDAQEVLKSYGRALGMAQLMRLT